MCRCKVVACQSKQCSCFRAGQHCGITCRCANCENKLPPVEPPAPPVEPPAAPVEPPVEPPVELSVFREPITVVSWNMCHFSGLLGDMTRRAPSDKGVTPPLRPESREAVIELTRKAFVHIAETTGADVIVLQEFPAVSGLARLELLLSFLGEGFSHDAGTARGHEHVFIWRTATVEPLKEKVDGKIHFVHTSLARPGGTMRLRHLATGETLFVTSVHLKSGGGEKTRAEYRALFAQYDATMRARFGPDLGGVHLVAGDFNLNPHDQKPALDNWHPLGSKFTRSSSGNRGYDFCFVDAASADLYDASMSVLIQECPKNSRQAALGISDHDPIVVRLLRYRA